MGPQPAGVPGVWVEDGFVPDGDALFALLSGTTSWDARMRARRTASFGVPYNYSGLTYPVAPVPDPVAALMDRLAVRLGWRPSNCLANFYPDGNSTMGFHADSTDELEPGTGVAVVSLGAERGITFRAAADKSVAIEYPLRSGSLLYMTAEVQTGWKHAILPRPGAGGRISLSFRRLRVG
jgi:alkylated DNA repair dioxygenase AlkB